MKAIRIGLLGASKISRRAVLAPAKDIDSVEVSSIAARQPERAANFAGEHNIPFVQENYAALIESENVDLVYNALPPSEHAKWSIAALRAGKHVLCEKPFAINASEAQQMVEAAKASGCYLIEAFHYRFHPLFERVLNIVRSNQLGEMTQIDARFAVPIAYNPKELRYDQKLGGGALMDLGCYPVHWVRTLMSAEPNVRSAQADWHETGVDVTMRAALSFPSGVDADIECSMSENLPDGHDAKLNIVGSGGTLTVHNPLAPHIGNQIVLETADGRTEETVAGNTTYFYQLQHVISVLKGTGVPMTGGADAVNNMRVLDRIYRLARD